MTSGVSAVLIFIAVMAGVLLLLEGIPFIQRQMFKRQNRNRERRDRERDG